MKWQCCEESSQCSERDAAAFCTRRRGAAVTGADYCRPLRSAWWNTADKCIRKPKLYYFALYLFRIDFRMGRQVQAFSDVLFLRHSLVMAMKTFKVTSICLIL